MPASSLTSKPAVDLPGQRAQQPGREPREAARAAFARSATGAGSLLWRIFAVNAGLFATAIALLALTPASVHSDITLGELITLIAGAAVLLCADLVLLRRALRPLRDLAAVMVAVDPLHPGRRALELTRTRSGGTTNEVVALTGAFNDMLDRLETERRDSARRALSAQESERLRIARELHDDVGQALTFVALRAEHALERPALHADALRDIAQAAHTTIDDVARIARELRPEALDDLGLVNALLALCSRVAAFSGRRVERDLQSGGAPLGDDVELVIYRVAQEALTNAVRHSGSASVRIALHPGPDRVVLSVSDDGVGLPAQSGGGSGLAGMRERAVLVGAELDVRSQPGQGVQVTLTVRREAAR